jgi:protein-tyrosine phosphatase
MPQSVLFLCTGNFYRSRFAEILFNHLAHERGLDWRADSRGLARDFGNWNVGPISKYAIEALGVKNISCATTSRMPAHCYEPDFENADLVVALKEAEHRPLLARHFPDWENRVEYWHVHDLDGATPDVALSEIEGHVNGLVERLAK